MLILLSTVWGSVACAAPSPTSTGLMASPSPGAHRSSPTAAPSNVTQSFGALPEGLVGVWLVVVNTSASNRIVTSWQVYRISREDGVWTLERAVKAPLPIDEAFADARRKHVAFEPSVKQIKAVKQAVQKLTYQPQTQSFATVVLRSSDQIPKEPPPPKVAAGAKFSIEILDRTKGTSISSIGLYAKETTPALITGDTHSFNLTAAGFTVVPIELDGRFRMYRLQ